MMTRDELRKLLNNIPLYAKRAELIDKLTREQLEAGCDSWSDYIEKMLCHLSTATATAIATATAAAAPAVNPHPPDTLDWYLFDMAHSGCPWADSYDPEGVREFLGSIGGIYGKGLTFDQLSPERQGMFRFIRASYRRWRINKGQST
jgi:hypothetical protein